MTAEETFAEEVRRRRTALGLSQKRLAILADVSEGTVRNVESRRDTVTSKTRREVLAAIARSEDENAGSASTGDAGEAIARRLEAIADAYPEDLFPQGEVVFHAVRRAYQHAAKIARGEA